MRSSLTRPVRRATCVAICIAVSVAVSVPTATAADVWNPPQLALARAGRTPNRYDAPGSSCTGGLTAGAVQLRSLITRQFRLSDIGGYACRANTANRNRLSVHAVGRALDVMVTGTRGDQVADWLLANASDLGVQMIIWRHRLWRSGQSGVRPYGGPNPHTDHVHVEIFAGADPADVGLSVRVHLERARASAM